MAQTRCRHLVVGRKCWAVKRQHGMLVLSPRAAERLTSYTPAWPLPKLFRLTAKGALSEGVFKGETINTPSMLCVEDALDGLQWAEKIGGLQALIARSEANLAALARWVEKTSWVEFLAAKPDTRSCTSICLVFTDGSDAAAIAKLLEAENVALDVAAYRAAPAGLRIWGRCHGRNLGRRGAAAVDRMGARAVARPSRRLTALSFCHPRACGDPPNHSLCCSAFGPVDPGLRRDDSKRWS